MVQEQSISGATEPRGTEILSLRSNLDHSAASLAHNRPQQIHLLAERGTSPDRRPYAPGGHLQRPTYIQLVPRPEHNDFSTSHKAFKGKMPTFALEVLEVYSGPPVVIFKWRHWGYMANDYVGYNKYAPTFLDEHRWILTHGLVEEKKVTVNAHGSMIDIQGIVIARVSGLLQLEKIDVWFDPMDMFRQTASEEKIEGENKNAVDGVGAAAGCPVLGH